MRLMSLKVNCCDNGHSNINDNTKALSLNDCAVGEPMTYLYTIALVFIWHSKVLEKHFATAGSTVCLTVIF